jgi:hypothetical protein
MKRLVAVGILVLLVFAGAASSKPARQDPHDIALERGDYFAAWERAIHRECPTNDLKWVGYSDYALDLVDGFTGSLAPTVQAQVQRIVDYRRRCKDEIGGWSCYLAAHVDAFERFGLLKKFAAYGCEHYDCQDEVCRPRRALRSGSRHSPG